MKLDISKLERAFNPQCLVVIGGRPEGQWLNIKKTYKGKLYSVQVNPETARAIEAIGIENFSSLLDIPESIDLVIVAAPKSAALEIIDDCIRKEVAAVHFFTAGFSEINTEEGIELERQLSEKARRANLHLVGPNCMGIFNPKVGVGGPGRMEHTGIIGSVGLISQSGMLNAAISREAQNQGADINISVSFGNGVVLDSTDYLEYFDSVPEIKVIGMYLEGVKDGQRFLSVLRRVSAHKPVVIWKGGRTEDGSRAIASHTGSLAISRVVWDAAVKQNGGVKVSGTEELVDTLKALLYLSPVHGDRVGIAGGSGGQSVTSADIFSEAGLRVPMLTQESYNELATFFIMAGASYRNPIDPENNRKDIRRIMEILDHDTNIDNLVMVYTTRRDSPDQIHNQIDVMTDLREKTLKPLMAIVPYSSPEQMQNAMDASREFQEGKVPSFPSIERCARALRNAWEYYQHKNGIADN
ncbi:CoA-binding protein [Chloroflexota bacterium]